MRGRRIWLQQEGLHNRHRIFFLQFSTFFSTVFSRPMPPFLSFFVSVVVLVLFQFSLAMLGYLIVHSESHDQHCPDVSCIRLVLGVSIYCTTGSNNTLSIHVFHEIEAIASLSRIISMAFLAMPTDRSGVESSQKHEQQQQETRSCALEPEEGSCDSVPHNRPADHESKRLID